MQILLTLICDPARPVIDVELLDAVRDRLEDIGGIAGTPDWLAPGIACDLACAGVSPAEAAPAIRTVIGNALVDLVIHEEREERRRKLLIADMDSTIITVECLDEIADFAGRKKEVAAITEQAMRGELEFEAALRARIGMLGPLPEATLATAYAERVKLMPGAQALVQTMRANGAQCVLVSGGFTYFTERVAREVGFHETYANRLLFENGRLTGVADPILGREAKLATLRHQCEKLQITPDQALAVGDGANDLAMIEVAGMGVAYRAKPVVAAAARAQINHADLTALLYLQGYRSSEFHAG